jgi:HTH-type transcriptional regulator / antitoxin MqsA
MTDTIRCHACGADMIRDVRPDEVEYKGQTATFDQPGWYCQGCDEVVLDGADAAVANEAFVQLRADVDGLLTPKEVASIRTKLGLSQRQAGALLGGGPRAFQKYESGKDWVSKAMANLLRLLDRDPSGVQALRASKDSVSSRRQSRAGRSTTPPQQASGGA